MKKNFLKRTACALSATVLCAGAMAMFSACTTDHPKVTITYSFNGTDYAVTYTMSRVDAPKTVQHFIELADAKYYDGLCIHDYNSTFLYTGGYTLEENELVQKDYFAFVKEAEKNGKKFTQTVWANGADVLATSPIMEGYQESDRVPLYTVYGEFTENGAPTENARENVHSYGALVMYYSSKGQDKTNVTTLRNDNGKNNGGDKYDRKTYEWNSATSLFYTYLGASDTTRDKNYSVFGKVDDAGDTKLRELISAVQAFSDTLDENEKFTQEKNLTDYDMKKYEPIENVGNGGLSATFDTPVDKPIIVKSVRITKY